MSPTQPPDRHYCSRSRPTRSGTPTASPRRSPRYPAFVKPVIPFSRIRVLSFLNSSVLVGVIEDFRFREPARRSTYAMPRRGAAVHVAAGIADIAALAAQGLSRRQRRWRLSSRDTNGAATPVHPLPCRGCTSAPPWILRSVATTATSPTRSRDARPRKSESDRADRCSRTLEIGRRQKSRVDDARECICHATADHVRVTGQIGIDRTERSDQRSAWPCGETPMKASRPARNFSFSSHATRRSQCPPPRSSHITAAT